MKGLVVPALVTLLCAHFLQAEVVEVRLTERRAVLVPVLVNGQGPYEFLLDTGSTTSVIDRELAEELALEALGTTTIRTATGTTERVPIARVDRVDIGSHSARTVLVLSSRLEGIRSLDRSIRGVLGFNFLSRFRYLLDYAGKRLAFEPSLPVGGLPMPFDASERSIVVAANGLRLLLDTGATGLILFDYEGLDIDVNPRAPRRLSTKNGRRIASAGWMRRLDVGDESLDRVPVTLVPRTGLEERADGLLPGALFESIYFDHQNNFIIFNPTYGSSGDRGPAPSVP